MNSLRPDESLLNALVDGDPRARAIAESWRFHEPVTLMSSAELDELSERCRVTYNFPRTDREDTVLTGTLG